MQLIYSLNHFVILYSTSIIPHWELNIWNSEKNFCTVFGVLSGGVIWMSVESIILYCANIPILYLLQGFQVALCQSHGTLPPLEVCHATAKYYKIMAISYQGICSKLCQR